MKLFWNAVALCAVLLLVVAGWRVLRSSLPSLPAPPVAVSADSGPTIERIAGLSSLTALRVDVADAVVSELPGYTGSAKAVIIVCGDVELGVDLSVATFEQVDSGARRAVLHLPQPRVLSARLDHERTRLVGVSQAGLWTIVPGAGGAEMAVVNRAMRDAQRIVGAAGHDPQLFQRCRVQTEQVLKSFLKALGWQVEIRWDA